jgi:hypothetical protein
MRLSTSCLTSLASVIKTNAKSSGKIIGSKKAYRRSIAKRLKEVFTISSRAAFGFSYVLTKAIYFIVRNPVNHHSESSPALLRVGRVRFAPKEFGLV